MNEKISAILDGELDARERDLLWKKMGQDPALRATWGRYHMIGAALRKDIGIVVTNDLAAQVLNRIEHEPLPFTRTIGRLPMRHFAKFAGGLALAASVTAVAILSFKSILLPEPVQLTAATPATESAAGSATQLAKAAQDSSLNALLIKHNEFSPAGSINGMMPYVRVVSHNGDH